MADVSYDLKHVDADGNGIIGGADTTVISEFYGLQHGMIPTPVNAGITAPLYFYENSSTPVPGGTHISLDIWLGDPNDQLAEDVYGLAFTLQYEADVVDPESVQITFHDESWLSYNSPVLHMVEHPAAGRVDAGITRTGSKAANGYGAVATLDFVVIEDINGGRLLDPYIDLEIIGGTYMNSAGETFAMPIDATQIPLDLDADDAQALPTSLDLYPNPARDVLNVHVNGQDELLDSYTVYTTTGQELLRRTNINSRSSSLELGSLPSGMYFVQALTQSGELLIQKFEIID